MIKLLGPACVAALLLAAPFASAQPVRLELRIVRQSGTLPGPITDIDVGGPYAATIGEVLRFELQYRVLDLNLTDDIVPAGVAGCGLDILSTTPGYRFRRGLLSSFEGVLASGEPPASVDSSGLAFGPAAGRRGMHAPLRTFQNQNVNFYPANGTLLNGNGANVPDIDPATPGNQSGNNSTEGDAILNFNPINLGERTQGNANLGYDNTAWYGVYTFDVVVGASNATLRARAIPDIDSGFRFSYFNDGFAVPLSSSNSIDAAYAITVPAPATAAPFAVLGLLLARRRSA